MSVQTQRGDRRLRRLTEICLSLPETERTLCGAHADFRVGGRIFAYYLRNHLGERITSACFQAASGEHLRLIERDPVRRYLPRCIGAEGWFAVRLDLGEADWDEMAALAKRSYDLAAPMAIGKAVEPPPAAPGPRSTPGSPPGPWTRLPVLAVAAQAASLAATSRPPGSMRSNSVTSMSLVRTEVCLPNSGQIIMGPLLRPVASLRTGRTVTPRVPGRRTQPSKIQG